MVRLLILVVCGDVCFVNYTATTEIYAYLHTLSLHDALPISIAPCAQPAQFMGIVRPDGRVATRNYIGVLTSVNFSATVARAIADRFRGSEEHTSELQSLMRISYAVFCLNKKKNNHTANTSS